jgi:hypothetical protein
MLLLTSTSDIVRVVTDAAADIEVHASWVDHSAGVITPGRTNTPSIVTATTTTVVGSPAASTQRNVKHLSLTNNHAFTSCNASVEHTDGTNVVELRAVNLLAGENLTLDNNGNWRHYDANGGEYIAPGPIATQADMEAGASLVLVVPPGRQHFHPGHPKCWCSAGITGNILESYNITSVADTGTGAITVTIATDFSSANWNCLATIGLASTTVAQSCTYDSRAAGSVILRSVVEAGSAADPVTWSMTGYGDQA